MVSQGSGLLSLTQPNATPLLAVAPISSSALFPIPKWRARAGRGESYDRWWRAVQQLLNALDVTVQQLGDEPPPMPPSVKSQIVTRQEDESAARAAGELAWQQYEAALDHWQRVNTAIYWHVVPSLDLSGVHERGDTEVIDSLVKGHRAHGRALVLWALKHADMSDLGVQSRLFAAVHGSRLQDGATLTQLLVHLQHMYDHWIHLAGSRHVVHEPSRVVVHMLRRAWEETRGAPPTSADQRHGRTRRAASSSHLRHAPTK